MNDNIIGEILKELREEHGYSQQYVADKIGIARTTYVKYETGSSKPTRKLKELALLYGVSTDYILAQEPQEHSVYPSKQIKELAELFDKLSKEDQEAIINLTKHMASKA